MGRRLPPGTRLVLATHNAGKMRELEAMLGPHGVVLVSAGELGLPEPEETAPDFSGNARIKALAAAAATGMPALADDSGFSVAALGGAPGVVSARWAGPGKDFGAAMARVHREMAAVEKAGAEKAGAADTRAWFTSVLCVAWPDGETASFVGRTPGHVVWPPRGEAGFGYDPMFRPEGESRSYGEMSPAEKHRTNHRARALAQLFAAILPLPSGTSAARRAGGEGDGRGGSIMRSLLLLAFTGAVTLAASAGMAQAQYYPPPGYPPPPPPGYPPPPPPPYRYDEGRPPPPPPPYYDRRPIGYRCSALVSTPGGSRTITCPLPRGPRPLDAGCECPPPPPPPGFSYGPALPGRVVP